MVVKNVRDKILKLLKKHPEGLMILDISKLIDVSRVTVSKYIYVLTLEGVVVQRRIGSAKLCFLKRRGKK